MVRPLSALAASNAAKAEALRSHPWACAELMSPARLRPARLQYMDALLGRLREAGFSPETTYHAYHVLDGHIFGFSLWETSHTSAASELSELAATFAQAISAGSYPHLREHGQQHSTEGPLHAISAFEFGLDLILEGLQKIHHGSSMGPATR
jgi:hypothetical protein